MEESKPNLYQKLLKITEEIGHIEKTGRNSQQGYAFIEQAAVVAELRPQLTKYGVFIIPETIGRKVDRYEVTRSNGKTGVDIHVNVISRYTVINADDPADRFEVLWDGGEAIDSGDKATNKATTASNKYFLMKLFNISDKDDADADADSPSAAPASNHSRPKASPTKEPASEDQVGRIRQLAAEIGYPDDIVESWALGRKSTEAADDLIAQLTAKLAERQTDNAKAISSPRPGEEDEDEKSPVDISEIPF